MCLVFIGDLMIQLWKEWSEFQHVRDEIGTRIKEVAETGK